MDEQSDERHSDEARALKLFSARQLRAIYFNGYGDLFGEPGWDILLCLFVAYQQVDGISLTDLAYEIGSPLSSVSRWAARLQSHGLILRVADLRDNRRIRLSLTELAYARMRKFFEKLHPADPDISPCSA